MKNKNVYRYGLYIILGLMPALLFLIYCAAMTIAGHPVRLVPSVLDEMFWYHQISAVVKSGRPLGFFGYNGGRAPIGTFGPWGVAVLLPYALFGKIFGWSFHSMTIANIVFLGAALVIFACLCSLTIKETAVVMAVYAFLLMNMRFSISNMAESLRWSMTIVLLGCMIRIYRGYAGNIFKYLIVPLLLLFCTEAYLLSGIFIPVYLMEVLPGKRFILKGIIAALISVAVIAVLYVLLINIESGYKLMGDESSLIRQMLDNTQLVLNRLTPGWLFEHRRDDHGFISVYFGQWMVLLIFCTVMLIYRFVSFAGKGGGLSGWYCDKELMRSLLAFYLLAGTLAGFCLVYASPSAWTVVRGMHTVLICAVFLYCLTFSKGFLIAFIVLALASLPSFAKSGAASLDVRYQSDENMALLENTRAEFEEIFDIDKSNLAWDNTIALYGSRKSGVQTALTLAMPEDAGYNVMLNSQVICDAKYAVVYRSFGSNEAYRGIIKNLKKAGYKTVWKHRSLTVLSR